MGRGYKFGYAPGHPLDAGSGKIGRHRLVLYDKIGPGRHRCHWCGMTLYWAPGNRQKKTALVADHVDFNPSNNDPANLVASCNACNINRSRIFRSYGPPIDDEELFIVWKNGSRHRAERAICLECGDEFLRATALTGDRGKFCSVSCARRFTGKRLYFPGRFQSAKTHCPRGHPYNKKNTRITTVGGRACRACDTLRPSYINRKR